MIYTDGNCKTVKTAQITAAGSAMLRAEVGKTVNNVAKAIDVYVSLINQIKVLLSKYQGDAPAYAESLQRLISAYDHVGNRLLAHKHFYLAWANKINGNQLEAQRNIAKAQEYTQLAGSNPGSVEQVAKEVWKYFPFWSINNQYVQLERNIGETQRYLLTELKKLNASIVPLLQDPTTQRDAAWMFNVSKQFEQNVANAAHKSVESNWWDRKSGRWLGTFETPRTMSFEGSGDDELTRLTLSPNAQNPLTGESSLAAVASGSPYPQMFNMYNIGGQSGAPSFNDLFMYAVLKKALSQTPQQNTANNFSFENMMGTMAMLKKFDELMNGSQQRQNQAPLQPQVQTEQPSMPRTISFYPGARTSAGDLPPPIHMLIEQSIK